MNPSIAVGDVAIDAQGLDPEQVRVILERRVRGEATQTAPREPRLAIILCVIGGERFAVPLAAIAEVVPAAKPTRVPGAPDSLTGLILRRGLVYNLIDPAAALGVEAGTSAHMLLLRGPVPRLALRVDEARATSEVAGGAPGGDDVTETRFARDGARIELIVLSRLVAILGLRERLS